MADNEQMSSLAAHCHVMKAAENERRPHSPPNVAAEGEGVSGEGERNSKVSPHAPLLKKNSQSDLLSRLKTRKVLGVGGSDDEGEAHRCKISQVLGNESKFSRREPLGLRFWQFVSAAMFTVVAAMALFLPDYLHLLMLVERGRRARQTTRLYGGAMMCISMSLWKSLHSKDKALIRYTFMLEASYFLTQILVMPFAICEEDVSLSHFLSLLLSRGVSAALSLHYYRMVGLKVKKLH
uniref:tumor protein p53-inducible protein 11-like n=1 Tax=Myxine glutinosa TaxID=7769 RepID=UPI00358F4325